MQANRRNVHLSRQITALRSPGVSFLPFMPVCLTHRSYFTRYACKTQVLPKKYCWDTGSGSIKTLNPLSAIVSHYRRYQSPVLDKGVASVATVAEVVEPV